ncbi:hypothetical protein Daesc_001789 [Daldinia eschscholtzii]|uniref:Uncharacterized protein n=1 Tax=Daldinia eschscholtzii TaxID=292717 RepID=A0AAX6MWE3_9PEZI
MLHLRQVALAGLGLSASVLGAALPATQDNDCLVDAIGCAADSGLKRDVSVNTPTPTSGFSPSALNCKESQRRCTGNWEEICDGFGVWQRWRQCAECFNGQDGTVDCVPDTSVPAPEPKPNFCKENQLRCNGQWEEVCDDQAEWHRLMRCEDCSQDTAGAIVCVPYVDLPPEPTHPPQCVEGTLRCEGRWLDLCNSDLSWQRIQQCNQCLTDPAGEPFCDNGQLSDTTTADLPTATSAPVPSPPATSTPATSAPGIVLAASAASSQIPRSPELGIAQDNPCFGGEVRCNGDRVEACTAEHEWQDFGPCPSCKQLYNTRVKCNYNDIVALGDDPVYRTVSA